MKEIQLTKGQTTLVDDEIHEYLSQFKWKAQKTLQGTYYARSNKYIGTIEGKKKYKTRVMHRLILEYYGYNLEGKQVDHINMNTLDNRLENLRPATRSENQWNRAKYQNNTSGFKGVSFKNGRWYAQIGINKTRKALGYFDNLEEAAKAYNTAAIQHYGEYACIN